MKVRLAAVWAGAVGMMVLRVLTVDLTEGQALLEYWWAWALFAGLLIFGAGAVKKGNK